MARHPAWFGRLDTILAVVRGGDTPEWFGRSEMKAVFGASERAAIRLLHQFGAEERSDALSVSRFSLVTQLDAVRAGAAYGAFLRQRGHVAEKLGEAQAAAAARGFRVRASAPDRSRAGLEDLPATIAWRRSAAHGPGRFEVLYDDGADLMWQLGEFLSAAGANRAAFFAGTEPAEDAGR